MATLAHWQSHTSSYPAPMPSKHRQRPVQRPEAEAKRTQRPTRRAAQPARAEARAPATSPVVAPLHGLHRVTRLLAARGLCSRREAERLLAAGQITVDGVVVREPGSKADAEARIELGERARTWLAAQATVLLHKPGGIASTTTASPETPERQRGRHAPRPSDLPAAWSLLTRERLWGEADPDLVEHIVTQPWYLSPTYRLDPEVRGLLLLSSDGVLARRLTSAALAQTWELACAETIGPALLRRLRAGVELDSGRIRFSQVTARGKTGLVLSCPPGERPPLRELWRQLGLSVTSVKRSCLGPWQLGALPEGCWRPLTGDELRLPTQADMPRT